MSLEILRKAVNAKMIAEWSYNDIGLVDFGANKKFDQPKDLEWSRLTVTTTSTENAQVGTGMQRISGFIVLQCFAPIYTGEVELNKMLNQAALIFQNQSFDGVKTFATDYRTVGETGSWFQKNALTPFNFDVFS